MLSAVEIAALEERVTMRISSPTISIAKVGLWPASPASGVDISCARVIQLAVFLAPGSIIMANEISYA